MLIQNISKLKGRGVSTFCRLLFFFFIVNSFLNAQNADSIIDEEIRTILFTSIETDGANCFTGSLDTWLDLLKKNHKNIPIESSGTMSFLKPQAIDSISEKYTLKLYKIPDSNYKNQSRYLLHYSDFYSDVWLRLGGYVENDFRLLCDYFLAHKNITRKNLLSIFIDWKSKDIIFQEIDFECMFKGYFKDKTNSSCFFSVFYIMQNDRIIGGEKPLKEDQLYSSFSRVPIQGYLDINMLKDSSLRN